MKYLATYDEIIVESFLSDLYKDPKKTFNNFINYIKDKSYLTKKTLIKTFVVGILATVPVYQLQNMVNDVDNKEIKELLLSETNKHNLKSFDEFVKKVGMRESSGVWDTINRAGYMGYFQLGSLALKDINVDINKIGKKKFLHDKELQLDCFKKYLKKNRQYMKKVIKEWNNKEIAGIKVTESGILMGAHLVGQKNAKKFFNSEGDYIPKDGNGTPITEYLKMFSGYKLEI
jgi:hypothetical protein